MTETISGGCLCGAVRYAWTGDTRFNIYACHCKDCQTRTGSAFGLQLGVTEGGFSISGPVIEGAHVQPSGAIAAIFACEKCLTRLYTTNALRPGVLNIRAGTLDDSSAIVPGFHLWIKSKQPWVVIPDDVPALETQPATPLDWLVLLKRDAS